MTISDLFISHFCEGKFKKCKVFCLLISSGKLCETLGELQVEGQAVNAAAIELTVENARFN